MLTVSGVSQSSLLTEWLYGACVPFAVTTCHKRSLPYQSHYLSSLPVSLSFFEPRQPFRSYTFPVGMVCITIGLRIYGTTLPSNDIDSGPLLTAINVVQVGNQLFSLGTNICATSVIARWAWYVPFNPVCRAASRDSRG